MTLERISLSWSAPVREMAEELAHVGRYRRGISELVERLIIAESKKKRGTAHLTPPITITRRSGRRPRTPSK